MNAFRMPGIAAAVAAVALLAGSAGAHESLQGHLMPYPFWVEPQDNDIYHVPTGLKVSFEGMMDALADARVIYIGEAHTNIHAHRVQYEIIRELERRFPGGVAIGMEMFRVPQQESLDRWTAGETTELEFLKESRWFENWQSDFGYYRDILSFARDRNIDVVALNPPKDLQQRLGMTGGRAVPPDLASRLPDTDGSDPFQRAMMSGIFSGHEGSQNILDGFMRIQLFWEETMASQIVSYLESEDGRGKKMVVIAGGMHVEYGFGVPKKVFRRKPLSYAIVLPAAISIPEEKQEEVLMEVDLPEIPLLRSDFIWMVPYEDLEDRQVRMGIRMSQEEHGVLVAEVMEASPAELAGLEAGDRIVSLDGLAVESTGDVLLVVRTKGPGDEIRVVVERSGRQLSLTPQFVATEE